MKREYHRWHSPNLNRDMEMLVFGHAGAKVLVFPTRDGRFWEYEKIGIPEIAVRIQAGLLQVYCVDSIDHESFYCFWSHPSGRIRRHIQFEQYILEEVLTMMAAQNPNPRLIAHGCSLGAFHAVNIAFRHPHLFQKVCALSGRYDLTMSVEHFRNLFDGYYDEDVYFHTPTHFLGRLTCAQRLEQLRRMEIVLAIGAEDPFLENNRQLSWLLTAKQIPHALHVWGGRAHQSRDWRKMIPIYL
jgi:esterase/lipase superfamily enzyme